MTTPPVELAGLAGHSGNVIGLYLSAEDLLSARVNSRLELSKYADIPENKHGALRKEFQSKLSKKLSNSDRDCKCASVSGSSFHRR